MDRLARETISRILGLIVMLGACGGDDPTPPPTPAESLTFTSEPTEALDRVPLSSVRVTALDVNGEPATLPIDVTIEATSARGVVALEGARVASTRQGVATFPELAVVGAGRGISLRASAPGLSPVTSAPFDVWLHFKQVTAGHTSTCGLTHENVTWCWGDNTLSRLGVGDDVSRSVPARIVGDFRFDTITAGGIQQCGRLASRDVLCWGGRHPTPTPVAGRKFTWVASGRGSCGVAIDGAFLCWNGPEGAPVITPTLIDNGPFRVSATYGMVCGIAPDQRGYCYGGNDRGQLGFAGTQFEPRFTRPVGDLRLTIIAPESRFVCGLATDGVVWCWGDNTYGQLGSASAGEWSSSPVRVDGGLRFTSVSVGIAHACALATDGTAWCWGGLGGSGPLGVQSAVPVRVTAPVRFASVDAGGYFACGRGVDGFTYCWGSNSNGELADGTTTSRSVAVRVVPP